MKPRVLIDTGFLYALMDRRDHWHRAARELLEGAGVRWSSSLLVLAEAHALVLHRLGEPAARTLQELIDALADLELFEATHLHHREVRRKLDSLRGHKLTYVDASSLVLLDRHGIKTVWGTDSDLGLGGATVLPRRR